MMCTSCAHLHGSTRFMGSCSMSSSPILPFEFTTGRLKCGTEEVWLPLGIEVLQAVARVNDPDAIVWRGDPTLRGEDQGVRILGTPLGHPDFVRSKLSALSETHDQLLEKVLTIKDLQCAWLLLLHCCGARANYTLRVVHLELTAGFAAQHGASLRKMPQPPCRGLLLPAFTGI